MNRISWNKITDTINARTGRERMLIMFTILVVMHMTTFYVIHPELKTQQQNAAKNIRHYHTQIETRAREIHLIVGEHKDDSDSTVIKKIQNLKIRINQFSGGLSEISNGFVDPGDMTALIKALLNENKLRIQRLENSPPEALLSSNNDDIDIYKHGIYLETSGSYHNHIRFLKKLEQLPWHIFWNEFNLQANESGESTVGLGIHTLNYNPVWLEI